MKNKTKIDSSRRKFIKTAVYVTPAVLTLNAVPAHATYGSKRGGRDFYHFGGSKYRGGSHYDGGSKYSGDDHHYYGGSKYNGGSKYSGSNHYSGYYKR